VTAAVLPYAIAGFLLALALAGWRLLRGPGTADRILALDTMYTVSMALLVLLGIRFDTALYFEAALVIAMLGFVGTVALAKYVARGAIIEDAVAADPAERDGSAPRETGK
jgi:multicomponent K+:H+ antiporter subunit F